MAFDNSFNIKIVTPNKVIDGIKAEKLTVLTKEGMISLLSHHVEFLHPVSKELISIEAPLPDDNLWRAIAPI